MQKTVPSCRGPNLYFQKCIPCSSIEGKWYNQLGSELLLTKDPDGKLLGEFRTAVESRVGAAGTTHAVVRGVVKPDPTGQLVGFSAIFNRGGSVTSWAGQCKKCEGVERLHTTWVLKGHEEKCINQWKSVTINEDTFFRDPQKEGPRKGGMDTLRGTFIEDVEEIVRLQSAEQRETENALKGQWYARDGSELEITSYTNGSIEGVYRKNSQSTPLTGNVDPRNPTGAFAIGGIREDLNGVDMWVGQYHNCLDGKDVLEMSRLRHVIDPSCSGPGEMTTFRKMPFTRTQPSENPANWGSSFNQFKNKVSSFFSGLFGS